MKRLRVFIDKTGVKFNIYYIILYRSKNYNYCHPVYLIFIIYLYSISLLKLMNGFLFFFTLK